MATLKKDIKKSTKWLVRAFASFDMELDYTVESVRHIEHVIAEQFENGTPKRGGLFAKDLGGKLFAISSYVGEVIIKNTSATKWVTDDDDPKGELNIQLLSANGTQMFPAYRIMKRIQNGEEDNIYHYTALAVKNYMRYEGVIPEEFRELEIEADSKPWWKFW